MVARMLSVLKRPRFIRRKASADPNPALLPAEPHFTRGFELGIYSPPSRTDLVNRYESMTELDGLQKIPGWEGFTPAEVAQWESALKGRRMFRYDVPLALDIQLRALRGAGFYLSLTSVGNLQRIIAVCESGFQTRERYRDVLLIPRSSSHIHCEDLPACASVVEPDHRPGGFIRKDRLAIRVDLGGIVSHVGAH